MKKAMIVFTMISTLLVGMAIGVSHAQTYNLVCFGAWEGDFPEGARMDTFCDEGVFAASTAENPLMISNQLPISFFINGNFDIAPNRSITVQVVVEVEQGGQWVEYAGQQPLSQSQVITWSGGNWPYWGKINTPLPSGNYRARAEISDAAGIMAVSENVYFAFKKAGYTFSCFGAWEGYLPEGVTLDELCTQEIFVSGTVASPFVVGRQLSLNLFFDGSFNIAPNKIITQRVIIERKVNNRWVKYAGEQPEDQSTLITWTGGHCPFWADIDVSLFPDGDYRARAVVLSGAAIIATSAEEFYFRTESVTDPGCPDPGTDPGVDPGTDPGTDPGVGEQPVSVQFSCLKVSGFNLPARKVNNKRTPPVEQWCSKFPLRLAKGMGTEADPYRIGKRARFLTVYSNALICGTGEMAVTNTFEVWQNNIPLLVLVPQCSVAGGNNANNIVFYTFSDLFRSIKNAGGDFTKAFTIKVRVSVDGVETLSDGEHFFFGPKPRPRR